MDNVINRAQEDEAVHTTSTSSQLEVHSQADVQQQQKLSLQSSYFAAAKALVYQSDSASTKKPIGKVVAANARLKGTATQVTNSSTKPPKVQVHQNGAHVQQGKNGAPITPQERRVTLQDMKTMYSPPESKDKSKSTEPRSPMKPSTTPSPYPRRASRVSQPSPPLIMFDSSPYRRPYSAPRSSVHIPTTQSKPKSGPRPSSARLKLMAAISNGESTKVAENMMLLRAISSPQVALSAVPHESRPPVVHRPTSGRSEHLMDHHMAMELVRPSESKRLLPPPGRTCALKPSLSSTVMTTPTESAVAAEAPAHSEGGCTEGAAPGLHAACVPDACPALSVSDPEGRLRAEAALNNEDAENVIGQCAAVISAEGSTLVQQLQAVHHLNRCFLSASTYPQAVVLGGLLARHPKVLACLVDLAGSGEAHAIVALTLLNFVVVSRQVDIERDLPDLPVLLTSQLRARGALEPALSTACVRLLAAVLRSAGACVLPLPAVRGVLSVARGMMADPDLDLRMCALVMVDEVLLAAGKAREEAKALDGVAVALQAAIDVEQDAKLARRMKGTLKLLRRISPA